MDLNDLNTLWSGNGRQVFVATHLLHVKGLFKPEEKKIRGQKFGLGNEKGSKMDSPESEPNHFLVPQRGVVSQQPWLGKVHQGPQVLRSCRRSSDDRSWLSGFTQRHACILHANSLHICRAHCVAISCQKLMWLHVNVRVLHSASHPQELVVFGKKAACTFPSHAFHQNMFR